MSYAKEQDIDVRSCYIVIHRNYSDGTDAYAFWNEKTARKSVEEDVEVTLSSLREQGYQNAELLEHIDGCEIYVPDRDIYYEWSIGRSAIK